MDSRFFSAWLLVAICVLGLVVFWEEQEATESYIKEAIRGSVDAECITSKLTAELDENPAQALTRRSVGNAVKQCKKERSPVQKLEQDQLESKESRLKQYKALTGQTKE